MTLYINACVRKKSRTNELARCVLAQSATSDIQEVNLQNEQILPLDEKTLTHRDECIARGDFSDPRFSYAWQFARADEIVICPYWDLLFPPRSAHTSSACA